MKGIKISILNSDSRYYYVTVKSQLRSYLTLIICTVTSLHRYSGDHVTLAFQFTIDLLTVGLKVSGTNFIDTHNCNKEQDFTLCTPQYTNRIGTMFLQHIVVNQDKSWYIIIICSYMTTLYKNCNDLETRRDRVLSNIHFSTKIGKLCANTK